MTEPIDLARTYEDLIAARAEAKDFRAQAELYLRQRDDALHDLARAEFDLRIANAQLAAAVQFSSAFNPGVIVVARQDVGPCVLCGRPIVRSQGVEALRAGSTTKPTWAHAVCPDLEEKP